MNFLKGFHAARPRGIGSQRRVFLARCELLEPKVLLSGGLDPGFGLDGKVIVPYDQASSGDLNISALAVQDDGKIVVAGQVTQTASLDQRTSDFLVVRLNSDGSVDTGFGNQGKVLIPFSIDGTPGASVARSLAIQPDGKIVVSGSVSGEGFTPTSDMAVARLNTNGSLDTSFGTEGSGTVEIRGNLALGGTDSPLPFGSVLEAQAMALGPDGQIVLVGMWYDGRLVFPATAVAELTPDGHLASDFGTDGLASFTFGEHTFSGATSVAIQTDGRIVVAGSSQAYDSETTSFTVLRINPDASIDSSFAQNGWATLSFDPMAAGSSPSTVRLQPDGRIVVAGTAVSNDWTALSSGSVAVGRLNPDGSPDSSFGTDGQVSIKGSDLTSLWTSGVVGMALQADGKIVAVGAAESPDLTNTEFSVLRLNQDGSIDTDFGTNGVLGASFGSSQSSTPSAVAIDPNGLIVVAGTTFNQNFDMFTTLPFDPGSASINLPSADGSASATTAPEDVAPMTPNSLPAATMSLSIAVARLLPSGTSPVPDETFPQPPPRPQYPPVDAPWEPPTEVTSGGREATSGGPEATSGGSNPPSSTPDSSPSQPDNSSASAANSSSNASASEATPSTSDSSTSSSSSTSGDSTSSQDSSTRSSSSTQSSVSTESVQSSSSTTIAAPMPPKILSVVREGRGQRTTSLSVGFSRDMKPSTVLDTSAYTVSVPGRHGRPNRPVPVTSVTYNSSTHSLSLVLKHPVPLRQPLMISIRSGLADTSGANLPAFSTLVLGSSPRPGPRPHF